MQENSGSFQKIFLIDTKYYIGLSTSYNSQSNQLHLTDNSDFVELNLTLDTGKYTLKTKVNQPGNTYDLNINLSMPFNKSNNNILANLPANFMVIIKDYEGLYRCFGNQNEPIRIYHSLKVNSDFNQGKFISVELTRILISFPHFILNPFDQSSGSGQA